MATDLEAALDTGLAPWSDPEFKTKYYWAFMDSYPVSDGHMLFVPTMNHIDNISECFSAATKIGYQGVENNSWQGFNVGLNMGTAAGQTVMYPHVHLIPRRIGDSDNVRGGVRKVIDGKGDYAKN